MKLNVSSQSHHTLTSTDDNIMANENHGPEVLIHVLFTCGNGDVILVKGRFMWIKSFEK